ncbi:MAG: hypothetical protein DI537_50875, partial [Stutzerimonas stutzeri]
FMLSTHMLRRFVAASAFQVRARMATATVVTASPPKGTDGWASNKEVRGCAPHEGISTDASFCTTSFLCLLHAQEFLRVFDDLRDEIVADPALAGQPKFASDWLRRVRRAHWVPSRVV